MSDFQIINPIAYSGWNDLLLAAPGASFFHTAEWAKVLSDAYGYQPYYFAEIENSTLKTLLPLMEVKSFLTGKRGVSLPFTDFCPIIASTENDLKMLLESAADLGRKNKWKTIEFRDNLAPSASRPSGLPASNAIPSAFSLQPSAANAIPSAFSLQPSAANAIPSAFSLQPSAANAIPSASQPPGLPAANAIPSASQPPGLPASNAIPSASQPPGLPASNAIPSASRPSGLPASNAIPSASQPPGLPASNAIPSASQPPGLPASLSFITHELKLNNNPEDIFSGFRESTRRNIRKAEKEGVGAEVCTTDAAIKEFYRLNCTTRKKHGLPPQPSRFFDAVFRHILSKDQGIVVLATYKGKVIAAAVYFHFRDRAIFKYGASDQNYQRLRPNYRVMWEAIKWYAQRGYRSLHFGRTDRGHGGLLQFKSGWGAAETPLNYYQYDPAQNVFMPEKSFKTAYPLLKITPLPLLKLAGRLLYRHVG